MVAQVEPEPHEDDERVDPGALVASAAEHIADQARRHPVRTLGIAFGTGWVLGGGVPRFVVRMAVTAGLRAAGQAILTSDAVADLAHRVLGTIRERSATAPPKTPTPKKNGHARRGKGHGT